MAVGVRRGHDVPGGVEGLGRGAGDVTGAVGGTGDPGLVVDRVDRTVLEPGGDPVTGGGVGVDGRVAERIGHGGELIRRVVKRDRRPEIGVSRAGQRRSRGRRARAPGAVGVVGGVDAAPDLVVGVVLRLGLVAGAVDSGDDVRRRGRGPARLVGVGDGVPVGVGVRGVEQHAGATYRALHPRAAGADPADLGREQVVGVVVLGLVRRRAAGPEDAHRRGGQAGGGWRRGGGAVVEGGRVAAHRVGLLGHLAGRVVEVGVGADPPGRRHAREVVLEARAVVGVAGRVAKHVLDGAEVRRVRAPGTSRP